MRYLQGDEKQKSRQLWEHAFPEDSKEFADYYYQYKVKDNKILAEEDQGEIVSMIQRNPYKVVLKDREYAIDYIVGVATDSDYRRKGYMKRLLTRMMEDMYQEGMPFTFLMPAAEAIYYPFDFRYIYRQPEFTLDERAGQGIEFPAGNMGDRQAEEISEWMEKWLRKRWSIYTRRTKEYVKRLDQELASEKGSWKLYLTEEKGASSLEAVQCLWGLKKKEQRLLYGEEGFSKPAGAGKPAIMARIIDLPKLAGHICLSKECPYDQLEVKIGIKDQFLPQNYGTWIWSLHKKGSSMKKISDTIENDSSCDTVDIGAFCQWIFGYTGDQEGSLLPEWKKWIQTLSGVFLDEVV